MTYTLVPRRSLNVIILYPQAPIMTRWRVTSHKLSCSQGLLAWASRKPKTSKGEITFLTVSCFDLYFLILKTLWHICNMLVCERYLVTSRTDTSCLLSIVVIATLHCERLILCQWVTRAQWAFVHRLFQLLTIKRQEKETEDEVTEMEQCGVVTFSSLEPSVTLIR